MRYRIIIEKSKEIIIEETKLDLSKNIIIKKKKGWLAYVLCNQWGDTVQVTPHTITKSIHREKEKKQLYLLFKIKHQN